MGTGADLDNMIQVAMEAYRGRRWEQALLEWDKIIDGYPDTPFVSYMKGMTLIEIDALYLAQKTFEELIDTHPDLRFGYSGLATLAKRDEDWDLALERWNVVLERFPDDVQAPLSFAQVLEKLRRFSEAEVLYNSIIDHHPDNAPGYEGLARIAEFQRKWELAYYRWEAVRIRFPKHDTATLNCANALLAIGRFDEAETLYRADVDRRPERSYALVGLAKIAQQKEDWETAYERWDIVRSRFPDHESATLNCAHMLSYLDRFDEAEALYMEARDHRLDHLAAYVGLATIAQRRQDWDLAFKRWQTISANFPREQTVPYRLAEIEIYRNNLDNATEYVNQLLDEDPKDFEALILQARILSQSGRNDEAWDLLLGVHQAIPDDIRTASELGTLAFRRRNYAAAAKYLHIVLEADPENIDLAMRVANAYLYSGNLLAAREIYEGLVENYPDMPHGFTGLIALDNHRGNHAAALEQVHRALKRFPDSFVLYRQALEVERRFQNVDACWGILHRARRVAPDEIQYGLLEGQQYYFQHEFEKALAVFEGILEKVPGQFQANLGRIQCIIDMGELERATRILLDLSQTNRSYLQNRDFLLLCILCFTPESLDDWRQLAESISDQHMDYVFLFRFVEMLESNHRISEALDFTEMILSKPLEAVELQVHVTGLFEKGRLENLLTLIDSDSDDGLRKQFQDRYKQTLAQVHEVIWSATADVPESRAYYTSHQQLLETIYNQYDRVWLSTSPTDTLNVVEQIRECIEEGRPLSLLRLGDGEGHFLPVADLDDEHTESDQREIQRTWWGEPRIQGMDDPVVLRFLDAVESADMVGIQTPQRLYSFVKFHPAIVPEHQRVTRGLLRTNAFVAQRGDDPTFCQKSIISSWVHHELNQWGLYELLFSYIHTCSVITCHVDIDDAIRERYALGVRAKHLIPPEFRWHNHFKTSSAGNHYPQRYEELCDEIDVAYPGEVFLVGAGFLGRIYCDIIRQRGGIALDVGSAFDYWMSYRTRPWSMAAFGRTRGDLWRR